ncbi:polysaccharide deacetylase family protein [Modestobacter versicolor]|uniref:Peptidoglycan/xylan/chitin deacetylase (PgdA/CDA1 family) n=1 Tax=Modestobacter versicolor TaxID=429133 RepID=A0A323VF81_9ACTN|nr:polysaccharide deacetylase family protein [Modestobacter versicolor]MBB3676204.1 peptidoglycan/xylan/chitin deacetylase (PgdA/CDA1 family) [Modestobacter versicolor]PZA21926.1 polysaccharide deacetylase family protein [Modestobacter versicolor]
MDRRSFLTVIAAGMIGAAVGRSTASPSGPAPLSGAPAADRARLLTPNTRPDGVVPVAPPVGPVTSLPGPAQTLALTIDDGTSTEVVAAFVDLAATTGVRLTFFPNGVYSSWTDVAPALRPLVESGQVAFGNHTWSHPDLATLSDGEVAEEITRADEFLKTTYGVTSAPFLRPPFGSHTDQVDRIAADLGHPTIALWNGTLGDHRQIGPQELLGYAQEWFLAQAVVVGHANRPAVTEVLPQFVQLIEERQLVTVTLADVWSSDA